MKIKNKLLTFLLFLLFSIPLNVFAYSSYLIPGGETVGIEVNSKGVLVVGFYKVRQSYIGRDAGFQVGDRIVKVNNKEITTISSMQEVINQMETNTVEFEVIREGKNLVISFSLEEDQDHILKTGLYVKDNITGIGTLTYIDPETKIFGALGHEIDEKTTASKFEISHGIIFGANVVGIDKSSNGVAGEKEARYDKSRVFGEITGNEISGIFGSYTSSISKDEVLEVGEENDVKIGKATILTVLDGEKKESFDIEIVKIDDSNETKNILFEVVDQKLIEKAGGIVQGMSGSPIIQDNKIIGAVTHVIVNDTKKGYGIFITTMLKEGEN